MVLDADAVVDPLAMVIETLNTLVADVAVTWVSRADDLAVRAEQVRLKLLNQANEWNLRGAFHEAGLHPDSQAEESHCAHEKRG